MEVVESSRSRSKRDYKDSSRGGEDEEDWDAGSDRRKHRSSKSRKYGNVEEVEDQRRGYGERSDGRRKFGSSSRADSEEDEYDVRREPRSKTPKKYPEDRVGGERRLGSDAHRDVEPESGSRKARNDDSERNSSKKASVKSSVQEADSQSRSRNRTDRPSHDIEYEKVQEKDSRYSERKDGSREKGHGSREQERSSSRRRWDEVDPGRKLEENSYGEKSEFSRSTKASDNHKQIPPRDRGDNRNEPAEGKSKYADSSSERSVKSAGREEKRVEVERSKSRSRPESLDENSRLVPSTRDNKQETFRDGKHRRDSERALEDGDNSIHKGSSRAHLEKTEKHKQQPELTYASRDDADVRERVTKMDEDGHSRMRDRSTREIRSSRRSRSPERRYHRDLDELDRGYSESDNERGSMLKGKERERDTYRDDWPSKGKDSGWGDRGREREVTKEHWKRSHSSRQDRDHREGNMEFEYDKEWDSKKRDQDWVDGEKLHSRTAYRKDNRSRGEMRSTSSFANTNDHSDTIEIRPNKNLDFAREEHLQSYQGRRLDGGFPQETNDDEWRYQADDRDKTTYDYGDDFQERFPEDVSPMEHNFRRNSLESHGGKARGQKALINSGASGAGQISSNNSQPSYMTNQASGSHNRTTQQGPKGARHTRGRGRPSGRDGQRVAMPIPMMGPPFGHLGLPPGPMPPMGPNVPASPAPPIGPNVFIPPFPGPVIWPGARGADMNMLAVPPSLSPMPQGPVGPRLPPNVATGPNHGIYFNQSGPGRAISPNIPGSGFDSMGAVGRGVSHDKPPTGWVPPRSSGPPGKAPSRGEQNDYSQNFVDTGMRPQNFIRELELTSTVEDYPKLRELIQRKDEIVAKSATAPMYHKCDLHEHILTPEFFGTKFDVILVDPPWEEYVHRAPGVTDHMEYWTFEEILNLKIEAIADTPSFIFLWVGDGVGLEQGRQCLKKWGFRRCEDICWVKTNKSNATPSLRHDSHTLFQHTKEHCLMGIKGTVRRSTDGHIIHANIDTDIIIAEEPPYGSTKKPEDIYRIIEHFSLGRRRLELFGEDHNIRSGWLTVGKDLSSSNFKFEEYCRNFSDKEGKVWQGGGGRNPPPDAPHLVLTTPDIESLRPKSPPQKNQSQQQQQQQQSTSISTTANSSKRPAANSPQKPASTTMLNVNQEVSSTNPPVPPPWSASSIGNYKVIEPAGAGPDDKFFEGYAFNPSRGQITGDHHDYDSR